MLRKRNADKKDIFYNKGTKKKKKKMRKEIFRNEV